MMGMERGTLVFVCQVWAFLPPVSESIVEPPSKWIIAFFFSRFFFLTTYWQPTNYLSSWTTFLVAFLHNGIVLKLSHSGLSCYGWHCHCCFGLCIIKQQRWLEKETDTNQVKDPQRCVSTTTWTDTDGHLTNVETIERDAKYITGLINTGNSCFINSVLQVCFSLG